MDIEDDKTLQLLFLQSVYLQKAQFIIKGSKVENVKIDQIEYIQFFDAVKDLQNGQVYSVFTKDE